MSTQVSFPDELWMNHNKMGFYEIVELFTSLFRNTRILDSDDEDDYIHSTCAVVKPQDDRPELPICADKPLPKPTDPGKPPMPSRTVRPIPPRHPPAAETKLIYGYVN